MNNYGILAFNDETKVRGPFCRCERVYTYEARPFAGPLHASNGLARNLAPYTVPYNNTVVFPLWWHPFTWTELQQLL